MQVLETFNSSKKKPISTLGAVRETFSKETFDNPNYKGLFYFFRDLIFFGISVIWLFHLETWYLLPFAWFFVGLTISGLFVIGHDCAHGALFKSEKLSYFVGQIAMLPSLHAFHQWAYGHNRVHHGHTIKINSDFVWHPVGPEEYQKFNLFQKLFHRISWSAFGSGIYYLWEIWLKGMIVYNAPIKEAKRDKMLVLFFAIIVSGYSLYLGGYSSQEFKISQALWMWFKLVFMPFLVWNYFIGFTVYVHHIGESIPWKYREDWSPFYGQVVGTVNYKVNPIYNFFVHNIYIHSPHHVHMKIPFYNLPRALDEMKKEYKPFIQERKSLIKDYVKNTSKCKLMNFETGEWMTYKQAINFLNTKKI